MQDSSACVDRLSAKAIVPIRLSALLLLKQKGARLAVTGPTPKPTTKELPGLRNQHERISYPRTIEVDELIVDAGAD